MEIISPFSARLTTEQRPWEVEPHGTLQQAATHHEVTLKHVELNEVSRFRTNVALFQPRFGACLVVHQVLL